MDGGKIFRMEVQSQSLNVTFFSRPITQGQNSIEELFKGIINTLATVISARHKFLPGKGGSPWVIIKNSLFAFRQKGLLNHITGDVHYLAIVLGKSSILTIHDIGSALNNNRFKRLYIFILWFWLPAKRARYITAISEFSKQEIIRLLPFTKQKIKVIPNAFRKELLDRANIDNPRNKIPRILCVGTKPNKNLERSIKAVENLAVHLVILGKLTADQSLLLKKYKIDYSNPDSLDYKSVIDLYLGVDLLCFPSTYEGFGMPILEAQVLGIPVLTANKGAMREVAATTAHLVDPASVDDIRSGIQKIIEEDGYRQQLITRGKKNVQRFHPDIVAKQYLALYRSMNDVKGD